MMSFQTNSKSRINWLFAFLLVSSGSIFAQSDLMGLLDEEEETTLYTTATFKGSRIINLQSTEIPGPGVMQFVILHRFGSVTEDPLYDLFGLDVASVRFSLDYSINEHLNFGIGRSSGSKTYDGWMKAKLLRQSTGLREMPISLLYYGSVNVNTTRFPDDGLEHFFSERMSYVNQIIVARKFTDGFSMEIAPTLVHFNTRMTAAQPNTLFGLAAGGRIKINNRIAITADYMLQVTQNTRLEEGVEVPYNNALSVGVDIETGGHVFQLHVTNARDMSDPGWMMSTPGNWLDGDIFFGFNISRVFTIKKRKTITPVF